MARGKGTAGCRGGPSARDRDAPRIAKPHDGMVRVEETRVEGARAAVVRASHVGLLLSRKVAALLCDHFRTV